MVHLGDQASVSGNGLMIHGSMRWTGAVTAIEFGGMSTYSETIGYPCSQDLSVNYLFEMPVVVG